MCPSERAGAFVKDSQRVNYSVSLLGSESIRHDTNSANESAGSTRPL